MKVLIPSPLLSYTRTNRVEASGGTMAEMLLDLDRQFPGLRFRVIDEQDRFRPNMRCFVNGCQTFDLEHPLSAQDEVTLIQALRGG